MPEQGQGKAAGCFLGSSHHNERPEAKQEGTFCSEPVQAKANSPAPPPMPCSPPSLLEVWTRPQNAHPVSEGEALSPKVGQSAEAPDREVIFEAFYSYNTHTHTHTRLTHTGKLRGDGSNTREIGPRAQLSSTALACSLT